MSTLWQDITYGFRRLRKNPGFTIVVVTVLAMAIGATTIVLSVVDAVMLRACPYKDSQHLVCVYETKVPERANRLFTSLAGFRDWREQSHVFEGLAGAHQWNGVARSADRAEYARGFLVSEGFFSLLGAAPILGRTFLPEEHTGGSPPVVVLSYDHWQHWFGGDPNAIGKTIVLDNRVYNVIGVLPKSFRWVFQGIACGLWMPLSMDGIEDAQRSYRSVHVIGRLNPGVSAEQAQAEMSLIGERLSQAHPETLADYRIQVVPINEDYARHAVSGAKPRTLLILLGVVTAVLLIACIHVANLLLARSVAREQEIALRTALGGTRLRIMRQLFTESLLLAAAGSALGLLLAYDGLDTLAALRNHTIPWYFGAAGEGAIPWFVQVHIDSRVLLYILGLFLLTCVLFGTLPALGATRINVSRHLSVPGTRTAGGRFQCLRSGLVITDMATAFVLLAGAGLLINSYVRVLNVDRRCNPKNVLTTSIGFDWRHAPEPARRLAIFQEALQRVRALPGVQTVSASSYSPVTGSYSTPPFHIEGQSIAGEGTGIAQTDLFPGYFRLLEIPLLQGRDFTEYDTHATAPVIIINEAAARRFWPGEPAVGRHLMSIPRGESEAVTYEVIGVVGNVWHARYAPDEPEVYVPYRQSGCPAEVCLMIRTPSDAGSLIAAIRRELSAVAEGAVVGRIEPMEKSIADLFSAERLNTLLLSAFAAAALLLASIGIHGTIAYAVSWRTREIGIRMALGAQGVDILKTVLGQGLRLALAGVLIGLVGAFVLTRVIAGMLYDVSPVDPLTFASVAALLVGVALLASYLPARRAAKVDPMVALRYE